MLLYVPIKKRGRPNKCQIAHTIATNDQAGPAKKRGRPKKTEHEQEAAIALAKKRRVEQEIEQRATRSRALKQ